MADRDTKLFISVSSQPGTLGARVYNYIFKDAGINAVYLPRIAPSSGQELIAALRALHVDGCSVSMPLKADVTPFLDWVAPEAIEMGSVNTIVRDGDCFRGYTTDYLGVKAALEGCKCQSALIFGSGGVTGSVIRGLREMSIPDIALHSRSPERGKQCADQHKVDWEAELSDRRHFDLVVNATPALDASNLRSAIMRSNIFFDMQPSQNETPLLAFARESGKKTVTGLAMFRGQVRYQCQLYTGILPDPKMIELALK